MVTAQCKSPMPSSSGAVGSDGFGIDGVTFGDDAQPKVISRAHESVANRRSPSMATSSRPFYQDCDTPVTPGPHRTDKEETG